jgi:hypothetical protein
VFEGSATRGTSKSSKAYAAPQEQTEQRIRSLLTLGLCPSGKVPVRMAAGVGLQKVGLEDGRQEQMSGYAGQIDTHENTVNIKTVYDSQKG